jgi:hypothetical protein
MPAALLQAIHRRVAEINRSARDGQFTERRAMLPRHARRPFWDRHSGHVLKRPLRASWRVRRPPLPQLRPGTNFLPGLLPRIVRRSEWRHHRLWRIPHRPATPANVGILGNGHIAATSSNAPYGHPSASVSDGLPAPGPFHCSADEGDDFQESGPLSTDSQTWSATAPCIEPCAECSDVPSNPE